MGFKSLYPSGVVSTSTGKNHGSIGSVHPVMDKHLQGTLCLLQFQPHLRRNWWEFWVVHILCGTKKPQSLRLRWYRIFQKLDLGTSPKTNQKKNRWTSTTYNNTRFKKKCWDANPLLSTVNIYRIITTPNPTGFRIIGIEFSLRGPGPRHDSPRWKDHLPCIANYDCSTPRTFLWVSKSQVQYQKKSPNSSKINWLMIFHGPLWKYVWLYERHLLLSTATVSQILVFQDFLKW